MKTGSYRCRPDHPVGAFPGNLHPAFIRREQQGCYRSGEPVGEDQPGSIERDYEHPYPFKTKDQHPAPEDSMNNADYVLLFILCLAAYVLLRVIETTVRKEKSENGKPKH
jgi:hypothetical protein